MANYPPGLAGPGQYGDPYMDRDRYERMMREQLMISQMSASQRSFDPPVKAKEAENPVLLLLGEG